jgi:hypothetical protein
MALVLTVALALLILEHDMPRRKSPTATPEPSTAALLKTLNPHAAGIDVGAKEMWVAVPEGSVPDRPHGPRREPLPGRVRRCRSMKRRTERGS